MICECGGTLRRFAIELHTLAAAREWLPIAQPAHLPLRVEGVRCDTCRRRIGVNFSSADSMRDAESAA